MSFITNLNLTGFEYYTFLVIASLFAFIWILCIIWTVRDVFRRSDSFLFQVFTIVLVIVFSILGLLVYVCIRPVQTIDERFESHWEKELFLRGKMQNFCAGCNGIIDSEFNICPWCQDELKKACTKCRKKLDLAFDWCPHCGQSTRQTPKRKKTAKKK